MKLAYYRDDPSNFGDELNAYLWPKILPEDFLDEDGRELFVGIGSILGEMFDPESKKFVFGSGIGGYIAPPDMESGRWQIIFVRGPRTAATLGLPASQAICDSAILLREVSDLPTPAEDVGVAFMPHFQSLPRGDWRKVCELAGVTFLDPTEPPEKLLSQIRGAKLVITEAMHGAIVSDALRTPWIAVQPFHPSHRMKWADWSEALDLEINWIQLQPSSLREWITSISGKGGERMQKIRLFDSAPLSFLRPLFAQRAARRLRWVGDNITGQMSAEAKLQEVTARARAALDAFVAERKSTPR